MQPPKEHLHELLILFELPNSGDFLQCIGVAHIVDKLIFDELA
jgi:hypothetical protein